MNEKFYNTERKKIWIIIIELKLYIHMHNIIWERERERHVLKVVVHNGYDVCENLFSFQAD